MDPTEIIAVPIPLYRLENFVGFAALVLFIVSVPWWELVVLVNTLKTLGITTFAVLGMAILCGAHPVHNLLYTVLASFYVASLISLNPPVFNDATRTTNNNKQLLLFTRRIDALVSGDDVMQSFRLYATLLTMIPFQILNILDSGLQAQRWPVPMLLGSTVGWILGSVLGLLWEFCYTTHNKSNATTITSSSGQVDGDEKKDRYYR